MTIPPRVRKIAIRLRRMLIASKTEAITDAVRRGDYDAVEQALAKGANVNTTDKKDGWSLLHTAAYLGHYSIVKLLLSRGANVQATSRRGATALYGAAHQVEVSIVQLLVENGARPSTFDLSENNGSGIARATIRQVLNQPIRSTPVNRTRADVNAKDADGNNPLVRAAQCGDCKAVKALIDTGADVSMWGLHDESALHIAAEKGHYDVVEVLIAAGADVNGRSGYISDTPLMAAAGRGHSEIVKLLILSGADVNGRSGYKTGDTALLIAACNGHSDIVSLLCAAGADVNAQCDEGMTALIKAASTPYRYRVDTVMALITAGADVNAKNNNQNSALSLAADPEIVKALKAAGATISEAQRENAKKLVLQATSGFFQKYGTSWTHQLWLEFLGEVRRHVSVNMLSDAEIGQILEAEAAEVRKQSRG